jgi:putative endonuclease
LGLGGNNPKRVIASVRYVIRSEAICPYALWEFSLRLGVNWGGFVYVMTNKNHTTLYVGVTSILRGRVWDHKGNKYPGSFTSKYSLHKLVYIECYFSVVEAIAREKELKGKSRQKKIELINAYNPEWRDLYDDL